MNKMRSYRIKRVVPVIAIILLTVGATAFAQGNLHFGRLNVITGLEYKGTFDDNVFRDPEGEESDYIHKITPSIKLVYPGKDPGNFLQAGYQVGIARYTDFDDQDYEDHRFSAAGGYRAPAGFYIKADDFFQDTADPYGSANFYNEGKRTKRWNNTLNLAAGYDFADKYTVELGGSHFVERYDLEEDQFQDRTRLTLAGAFRYRFSEKMQILAELNQSGVTYDEQNDGIGIWNEDNSQDNTVTEGLVGVRFLPTGKLVGDLKAGMSAIDYENEVDANGNSYNEDTIPTAYAQLSYYMTERTSFSAFAGRDRKSSATANHANDVSASYIDTYWGLGWSQGLFSKFRFDLEFARRLEDYQNVAAGNPDKRLIRHELNAGLNWAIKAWLDAGLTIDYIDKAATDSQYDNFDYAATQYGFYVALTY